MWPPSPASCAAVHDAPAGRTVAVGYENGDVTVHVVATQHNIFLTWPSHHRAAVLSATFARRDEPYLVTGGADGKVRILRGGRTEADDGVEAEFDQGGAVEALAVTPSAEELDAVRVAPAAPILLTIDVAEDEAADPSADVDVDVDEDEDSGDENGDEGGVAAGFAVLSSPLAAR